MGLKNLSLQHHHWVKAHEGCHTKRLQSATLIYQKKTKNCSLEVNGVE